MASARVIGALHGSGLDGSARFGPAIPTILASTDVGREPLAGDVIGRESELVVTHRNFRYASFGQWSTTDEHPAAPAARVPLPAVITLELPK